MKCVELRGDDSIRKWALYKKDQRILALASRELVAAEAHYHQTCYNKYTRCLYETDNVDTDAESVMEVEEKSYDKIENEAFIMLSELLRHELFPTHCVITMSKLLEKHGCNMNTSGVTDIKRSTRTHFRRKIETEFGNAVSILDDDCGRLLGVPGNVTVHDLAKTNQCLVKELEERKQRDATDKTELIKQAAQIIKADIKEKESERDWPPSLEDIEGYEIHQS